MVITLLDGQKIEGVIYSQIGSTMRVAVKGADDLVDYTRISGQWVSENCEPVEIEFAWQRIPKQVPVTEADCICSEELASDLVECLWQGGADDAVRTLTAGAVSERFQL